MQEKTEAKVEVGDLWKLGGDPEEIYYIVCALDSVMGDGNKITVSVREYFSNINLIQVCEKTYIDLSLDYKITNPKEKAFILLQMETAEQEE